MTAQYANNNLNIVMATDKNYIIPTMVTLASVMSSANKDTFFNIYISVSYTHLTLPTIA